MSLGSYQKYLTIKNDTLYEPNEDGVCQNSLGTAAFMKMIYDGIDLQPLQERLEQEIAKNPHNAAALLDSAYLMFLKGTDAQGSLMFIKGRNVHAFERQQAALDQSAFYTIRHSSCPKLRVLLLAVPGEISWNTPIEFLLQNEEIETTFWYVLPDAQVPQPLPEHDIAIVVAALADFTKPNTDRIQRLLQNWPKPVINRIEHIQKFTRDQFYLVANGIPGIYMPETKMVVRSEMREATPPFPYPFIIRPINSFGGQGLTKIACFSDLEGYLNACSGNQFFVSPFIDYSSNDGLFRKYRIVVIDGKAFPFHMGISEKWAIWYYKSGMLTDEKKIAEETDFIMTFDKEGLGKKYGRALNQLAKKIGSEYFVLDCAETKAGELLIFEGGHDMVVHDMDSAVRFPEKNRKVHELFAAFQEMLRTHALSIRK